MSRNVQRQHCLKRLAIIAVAGTALSGIAGSAQAGAFLPWCSGVTSGLVVGGLAASGIGAPVAVAGGVAEVAGLVGTWAGLDPGSPSIAASPAPSALTVAGTSFLDAVYQPLSLPGSPYDTLITDTNQVIAAMNAVTADVKNGAPHAQLVADGNAMGLAVLATAADYDAVTSYHADQTELNAAIADIATNGLPTPEVDFLTAAGWTGGDITALGAYVGAQTYNLAVPTVSFSDCAVCTAGLLIPEPSSLLLVSVGALGVAFIRRRYHPPVDGSV